MLLIEAGRPENFFTDVPSIAPFFQITEYAWPYYMEPQPGVCLGKILLLFLRQSYTGLIKNPPPRMSFFMTSSKEEFHLDFTNRYTDSGRRLRYEYNT